VGSIWTYIQGIEICRVILQWGIMVLRHPFRASSIWLYRRFRAFGVDAFDLINKVESIVGLVLTYIRGSEICRVLHQWGIRVLRHPSRASSICLFLSFLSVVGFVLTYIQDKWNWQSFSSMGD